jgi:hypothetical protein
MSGQGLLLRWRGITWATERIPFDRTRVADTDVRMPNGRGIGRVVLLVQGATDRAEYMDACNESSFAIML